MRLTTFHLVALELLSISTLTSLAAPIDAEHELLDSPHRDKICSLPSCSSKNYGVDTSFPIHHGIQDFDNVLGAASKRQLYKHFMEGCQSKYSAKQYACKHNEMDRIEMNLQQPKSMFVSFISSN